MSPAVTLPVEKPLKDFYLLIQPWAVYVKTAELFAEQGGEGAVWGKDWKKVQAPSAEAAREIGESKRRANAESKLEMRSYECHGFAVGF